MDPRDIVELQRRYRERWNEFGYDPRTLGWNKGMQEVRFAAVFDGLRPSEFESVLDVGCGFGDMLTFLRARGWSGKYVGVDLVPELIEEARRRHGSDGTFEVGDGSATSREEKLALAAAIGCFNHKLEDHLRFVRDMLASMWASTEHVVVLDFLSAEADKRRDDLFYADVETLFRLGRAHSRRIHIHHGYMPFELQLKVFHDDRWTVEVPAFHPYVNGPKRPLTPLGGGT